MRRGSEEVRQLVRTCSAVSVCKHYLFVVDAEKQIQTGGDGS